MKKKVFLCQGKTLFYRDGYLILLKILPMDNLQELCSLMTGSYKTINFQFSEELENRELLLKGTGKENRIYTPVTANVDFWQLYRQYNQ